VPGVGRGVQILFEYNTKPGDLKWKFVLSLYNSYRFTNLKHTVQGARGLRGLERSLSGSGRLVLPACTVHTTAPHPALRAVWVSNCMGTGFSLVDSSPCLDIPQFRMIRIYRIVGLGKIFKKNIGFI